MPDQMSLTDGISPYLNTIYLSVVLLTILCSLVCSLFVITIIYGWNEILKPLDWFIIHLSSWDIISLLFATPTIDNVEMNWHISAVFCKASFPMVYVGYGITVLTLCAICLERYYGICKPVLYQRRLNSMTWKWVFPGMWLLSFALFGVYFHVYDKKTVTTPGGATGHVCDETWKSESSGIFYLLVPFLFLTVLPMIFMVLMFVKIVKKLKVSRTPSSGGSAVLNMRRRKTVKMLLYMVLVHYLCWLPTIIFKLEGAFGTQSPWYWVILAFCDLPHYARAVFYTVIYYRMYPVCNSTFGAVCRDCFCCCTTRKKNLH